MLKFGSLKFCFAASLLVHAFAFGVVKWVGNNHRAVALQHEPEALTLNLVAAPKVVAEPVVNAAQSPLPTPPEPSLPVAPPPPPVVDKTEAVPSLPEPVTVREPTPPEPLPATPVTIPMPQVEPQVPASTATARISGDGSSAQPGEDATTSEARPGVKAHPNYLKNPEPAYPLQARRRNQQGLVLLEVKVSAQGRALEISIKETSGHAILDEAALKAVRDWEFEPARVGKMAVESRIEVPVRFQLAK